MKKSPEKQLEDAKKSREQSPKPKLIVSKIPTKPTRLASSNGNNFNNNSSIASPKFNSNQNFHHNPSSAKTFQIISPNVQRMISSHQTTTDTITASPTGKSYIHCMSQNKNSALANRKLVDKNSNLQGRRIFLKSNLPKPSSFAVPLTKNLSKISQSNGLVDSEEPIVHTITDNNCNHEESYQTNSEPVDSEKTPTNIDHNFNYDNSLSNNCIFNNDDDDDIQNVLNRTSELINNLLSGHNSSNFESLDSEESTKNSIIVDKVDKEVEAKKDEVTMKATQRQKYKLHPDLESDGETTCEAVNTSLKLTKSLDNVTVSDFKPTSSPKLSYSRAKLLSNQQLKSSPTQSPKLPEKRIEATTFSSDSKLNTSPSSKHRPLSAASISSSSSSTSTASSSNSFGAVENLVNGKLTGGITYLASIESLADHSENEGHPSLTMCERAALEIIDSEKSYVQDLGQIIRG